MELRCSLTIIDVFADDADTAIDHYMGGIGFIAVAKGTHPRWLGRSLYPRKTNLISIGQP